MALNKVQICVLSLLVAATFSCNNTNSNGIGLTSAPPKPVTPPDLTQQGLKLSETYKSTLAIPEVGFTKVIEFKETLELVSGVDCSYLIFETSTLIQKDSVIQVQYRYKQMPDPDVENHSSCPDKIDKYVNYPKTLTFEKYANNKVNLFISQTNPDVILKSNPNLKSVQVINADSRKLGDIDCVFVRLKLVDQNDEGYLLETHFSSMNSFLDLIDRKFISLKTSKVLSYRKLVTP